MVTKAALRGLQTTVVLLMLTGCSLFQGVESTAEPPPTTLVIAREATVAVEPVAASATAPALGTATAETAPSSPTAEPALDPTLPPAPTEQPREMTFAEPEVLFHGVRFTVPSGIAGPILARLDDDGGYQFDFGDFATLYVSPVESYAGTMAEFLPGAVQAGLEAGQLDQMPLPGANTYLEAQLTPLEFVTGNGFRAVLSATQSFIPLANSGDLRYVFQGLTADGAYLVSLYYDIDAGILLSGSDPAQNTNENAFRVPEDFDPAGFDEEHMAFVLAYNEEAEILLDALTSDGFTPDLALLDALVRSLAVQTEIGP